MKQSFSGVWNAYAMHTMNGLPSCESVAQENAPKKPTRNNERTSAGPTRGATRRRGGGTATRVAVAVAHLCADKLQHDTLVDSERLAALQLNALLVETLHGVHLASVRLAAAVHLAEAAAPDDAMHGEVVHRQFLVELQVLPLREAAARNGTIRYDTTRHETRALHLPSVQY